LKATYKGHEEGTKSNKNLVEANTEFSNGRLFNFFRVQFFIFFRLYLRSSAFICGSTKAFCPDFA